MITSAAVERTSVTVLVYGLRRNRKSRKKMHLVSGSTFYKIVKITGVVIGSATLICFATSFFMIVKHRDPTSNVSVAIVKNYVDEEKNKLFDLIFVKCTHENCVCDSSTGQKKYREIGWNSCFVINEGKIEIAKYFAEKNVKYCVSLKEIHVHHSNETLSSRLTFCVFSTSTICDGTKLRSTVKKWFKPHFYDADTLKCAIIYDATLTEWSWGNKMTNGPWMRDLEMMEFKNVNAVILFEKKYLFHKSNVSSSELDLNHFFLFLKI